MRVTPDDMTADPDSPPLSPESQPLQNDIPGHPDIISPGLFDEVMGQVAMPAIRPNAVAAVRADSMTRDSAPVQAPDLTPVKGQTDFAGRRFDPALHMVDDNGMPKLTKTGYVRSKPGQGFRAEASRLDPTAGDVAQEDAPKAAAKSTESEVQATASVSALLFVRTAVLVGGVEFEAETDEQTHLVKTFADYYRAKGIVDIPPGAALALGLGFFVLKRWNRPAVVERRKTIWSRIKGWYIDYQASRAKREHEGN